MKKISAAILFVVVASSAAQAVTVWEIRRVCGADSKTYCPKVGYGEPMKQCLNQNLKKLAPACKAVMGRINSGEKVTFF